MTLTLALIRTLTLTPTLNLTLILTPGDLKVEGHDFEVLPSMHGMRDEKNFRAVHQGRPAPRSRRSTKKIIASQ